MIRIRSRTEFSAKGGCTEQLLTEINKYGIKLYKVEDIKGVLYITTLAKNYLTIAHIARDNGVSIRVTKKEGIYFRLYRYRKRYGLVAGTICLCLLMVFLKNYIWDIDISEENEITKGQLLSVLEENGIKCPVSRDSFDVNLLEFQVKLSLKDVAWITIDRSGCKVKVALAERTITPSIEIPILNPCNVIATSDGQIINADVYKGKLLVEKGSGVAKGDIIVSGVLDDGSGTIMYQHADAKIIAECVSDYEVYMPYKVVESVLDDEIISRKYLNIFEQSIPLFWDSDIIENAKCETEINNVNIFGVTMPWKIKVDNYNMYNYLPVTYADADVISKLNKKIDNYIENFCSDAQIINVERKFFPDEQGIKAIATIKLSKNIAEQKEIFAFNKK